jgi:hypothetical protein
MLAISRFREVDDELARGLRAVAELWRSRPGCLGVDLVANLDEPDLWALVSRWRDVGSYRRAFSGSETKLLLTPVLLRAVNEPSAYLDPDELAGNDIPWPGVSGDPGEV